MKTCGAEGGFCKLLKSNGMRRDSVANLAGSLGSAENACLFSPIDCRLAIMIISFSERRGVAPATGSAPPLPV